MSQRTGQKNFPWRFLCAGIGIGVVAGVVGYNFLKFTLPDHLDSAKAVPAWMVDGRFATFTDKDMQALRRTVCSADPVRVSPQPDGSAIMTCGFPASLAPVRLFVANELDMSTMAFAPRT
jgi:hypothetical protein